MTQLLLDDAWAPITSEMGFLRCDALTASKTFAEWDSANVKRSGARTVVSPIHGGMDDVLRQLLPLTSIQATRFLFMSCGQGKWTAFFSNKKTGTDAVGPMSQLALKLKCRGIRAVCTPHTMRKKEGVYKGRYGANILEVYAPEQTLNLNVERSIFLSNDGEGWQFGAAGTPFDFEKQSQYTATRVTDRFTSDMLKDYLLRLGLYAFDTSFYQPEVSFLASRQDYVIKGMKEIALEEVRAGF